MSGLSTDMPIVVVDRTDRGVGLEVIVAKSKRGLIRDMLANRGTSGDHDEHIAFLKALRQEIPDIIDELEKDWKMVQP